MTAFPDKNRDISEEDQDLLDVVYAKVRMDAKMKNLLFTCDKFGSLDFETSLENQKTQYEKDIAEKMEAVKNSVKAKIAEQAKAFIVEEGYQLGLNKNIETMIRKIVSDKEDNAAYNSGLARGNKMGKAEVRAKMQPVMEAAKKQQSDALAQARNQGIARGELLGVFDAVSKMITHRSNPPPMTLVDGSRNPEHIATSGYRLGKEILNNIDIYQVCRKPKDMVAGDDFGFYRSAGDGIKEAHKEANAEDPTVAPSK